MNNHVQNFPIQIISTEPLPSQDQSISINMDLRTNGYSGILGLLNNAALLAWHEAYGILPSQSINYLQSCVQSTASALSTINEVVAKLIIANQTAEVLVQVCEDDLSRVSQELMMMTGELLPYLTHLSSELVDNNNLATQQEAQIHPEQ